MNFPESSRAARNIQQQLGDEIIRAVERLQAAHDLVGHAVQNEGYSQARLTTLLPLLNKITRLEIVTGPH